ncbi:MAG TPA: hypothetical protein PK675_03970 [Clostridia bacterium]|nr:hypothetical protein [Clostridia bacterium]
MTKKIIISFGLIIAIIVCSVLFVVVYKAIVGSGIEHFKQYVFSCQGRFNVYKDEQSILTFYLLDEEEFSEMGNKENISEINLYTTDGEILSVTDWEIKNEIENKFSAFYGEYNMKTLSLILSFDKSVTIIGFEVIYPDVPEYFDIGELNINAIERSEFEMFLNIVDFTWDFEIVKFKPGVTEYIIPGDFSMLYFNINSLVNDFELISVNIGVPGVGIDPSTLLEYVPPRYKEMQMISFDEEFTLNPDYEIYLKPQTVDVLPENNISLMVEKCVREHAIVSLCVTPEHVEFKKNNYLTITFYAPVFTFVDIETQTVFEVSGRNFCSRTGIYDSSIVEDLLNNYGV